MGNPLWVAGMKSPNPEGGKRHSVRTPKGMIQAFIKRHISPQKFGKLYNTLTESEKINVLLKLLPYVVAPAQAESLSPEETQELYERLETKLKNDVSSAQKVI